MKPLHICLLAALGATCWLPLAANAQWQWIDKDGHKVYSDQAPPVDIPDKNILRRSGTPPPRLGASATASVAAPDAGASAPRTAASASAKPLGVDKELEQKARKAEEASKAARVVEEQKIAAAKAENCVRVRQGKATVDSGMRIASLNAQGQPEVMDDKARATERQRLQSIIDSDCR